MPAELPTAAGVMLFDPDGHALFLRRSGEGDHPGEWCWPGGGVEPGETPEAAARREVEEETGHHLGGKLVPADHSRGDVEFSTFAHQLPARFEPRLNDEHSEHVWARPENPPQPLHPGVAATLRKYNGETDAEAKDCSGAAMDAVIAIDRSPSNRAIDGDGHLRVKGNLLSRAEISGYRGSEIPGWRELGLNPDKIYKLYRHPDELKAGAPTLEGKPILIKHQPISADDHPADLVAGAVSNPTYDNGAITGDISIWHKGAIKGITDDSKRHLSCGYHYEPYMEAGRTPDGNPFDGTMKHIRFNHLALVENPRVAGAMVADSADELHWLALDRALAELPEEPMSKIVDALREKYPTPQSVLRALGLDAGLLREETEMMPKKDEVAREGLKKLLAEDASLESITKFVEAMTALESGGGAGSEEAESFEDLDDEDDGEDEIPGAVTEPNSGAPELGEKGEGDEPGEEVATDGPVGKLHSILKGKLSPEELAEVGECLEQIAGGEEAESDEDDEHEEPGAPEKHEGEDEDSEEDDAEGEDEDEEDDDMNKDLVTKPAMDAAIQSAVAAERERAKGVDEAKRTVRPWVGELLIAFDSGEAVYRKALSLLNVEGADKVKDPDALPILLKLTPRPGQPVAPAREVSIGMDSASADSFSKMFPGAGRIEIAY